MTSTELEDILYRHSNQINKQHVDLFLSLIIELRICNISKINNLVLCINNITHLYYCEKHYSAPFDMCRCQISYEKYIMTLKLLNLYKRMFNYCYIPYIHIYEKRSNKIKKIFVLI